MSSSNCGGCMDLGAHWRWCPKVVGPRASTLGKLAAEVEALGDRIGSNEPGAANHLYRAAGILNEQAKHYGDLFEGERRDGKRVKPCPLGEGYHSDPCECAERLARVTVHTRTTTDDGPDFCAECSDAIADWVPWSVHQEVRDRLEEGATLTHNTDAPMIYRGDPHWKDRI